MEMPVAVDKLHNILVQKDEIYKFFGIYQLERY